MYNLQANIPDLAFKSLGFDWVFLRKIWVLLGFWWGQSGFLTNLGSGNPVDYRRVCLLFNSILCTFVLLNVQLYDKCYCFQCCQCQMAEFQSFSAEKSTCKKYDLTEASSSQFHLLTPTPNSFRVHDDQVS